MPLDSRDATALEYSPFFTLSRQFLILADSLLLTEDEESEALRLFCFILR